MDAAIAGEGVDLAPQLDAEAHRVSRIADADLLFQPRRQVDQPCCLREHQIDAIAEARLGMALVDVHHSPRLWPPHPVRDQAPWSIFSGRKARHDNAISGGSLRS